MKVKILEKDPKSHPSFFKLKNVFLGKGKNFNGKNKITEMYGVGMSRIIRTPDFFRPVTGSEEKFEDPPRYFSTRDIPDMAHITQKNFNLQKNRIPIPTKNTQLK